jgi:hypothetical protein
MFLLLPAACPAAWLISFSLDDFGCRVKELLEQHLGSIVLAIAILVAVIIHARARRYVMIKTKSRIGDDVVVYDRWTGERK